MSSDPGGAFRAAGRPARAARSVAAALACVTASAVGHLCAGGQLSAAAVLAVFAGGAAITWLLSARRVTAGQITGLLVLCQAGVHLGGSDAAMTMDATMLLAHVAATAVSAVTLARGERFVWHLAERLGLRLAPLLRASALVPSVRVPVPVLAPRSHDGVLLAHSRSLRGPPARSL